MAYGLFFSSIKMGIRWRHGNEKHETNYLCSHYLAFSFTNIEFISWGTLPENACLVDAQNNYSERLNTLHVDTKNRLTSCSMPTFVAQQPAKDKQFNWPIALCTYRVMYLYLVVFQSVGGEPKTLLLNRQLVEKFYCKHGRFNNLSSEKLEVPSHKNHLVMLLSTFIKCKHTFWWFTRRQSVNMTLDNWNRPLDDKVVMTHCLVLFMRLTLQINIRRVTFSTTYLWNFEFPIGAHPFSTKEQENLRCLT